MKGRVIHYYADVKKYFINDPEIVLEAIRDKAAGQLVHVIGSVFGVAIRPGKRWSQLCDETFYKFKANGVELEEISFAPGGSLEFVKHLNGCERVKIEAGKNVDLEPLVGNPKILDLQVYPHTSVKEFDLGALPNVRRCMVPLRKQLMSFLKCKRLISLFLCGGEHEGRLSLEPLGSLQEFYGESVKGLKSIELAPHVKLRSLQLRCLSKFESVEPLSSRLDELRVVTLDRVPCMDIKWLAMAEKVECISLRLGKLQSIKFLSGLKKLQVLDIFGSKVLDKDLSFRDSLKGELDPKYWGPSE